LTVASSVIGQVLAVVFSDPNRPVTCPLYLKNYKLTILGNRVKQVGVREGIIFGN
jgi:hypothetical protein